MKYYIIGILTIIILSYNGFAQIDCATATSGDPSCSAWSSESTMGFNIIGPQCVITVKYKTRVCNGVIEYMWYDPTVQGPCASMASFSIYHYNFSALGEYIDLLIMQHHYNLNKSSYPECPNGAPMQARTYSASCGVWVSCTYQIAPQNPECEKGYLPLPDPMATTVTTSKWMPCGETCCRKTYTICKKPDTIQGGYYLEVQSILKEKLIECTDQANFDKPCQDGC